MSIGSIFSREKKDAVVTQEESCKYVESDIVCDNYALKKYVTDWCDNEGYKFEGLAMFLEKTGIELPVKLSKLDKSKRPYSFQCIDSSEKEYTISLIFGDFIDYCSEIRVTEKNAESTITRQYDVGEKYEGEVTIPYIVLSGRVVERNDVKLSCYYSKYLCSYTAMVHDTYKLEFKYCRPGESDETDCDSWVCENNNSIEEYLLNYNYAQFDVDEVYTNLKNLVESEVSDLLLEYEKMNKAHTKAEQENARSLAMISVNKGKVEKYGYVTQSEKSFWVSNKGDWSFSSDNCEIAYTKGNNRLRYSVESDDEEASKINMVPIIENVKKEISKLWSKVGL